jgi:Uma2 family endonuclease
MVQYNPLPILPGEADLPETDNLPVDNELQILIPTLLRAILACHWSERLDWFLGVNLGVYYDPNKAAIGPDGFLSIGVPRFRAGGQLRLSYPIWQENQVIPQWVLEVVSKTPGNEYGSKMSEYADMGALYYTIYNPDYWRRDCHDPFEVYRLEQGQYVRQPHNPFWMPEVGLGIGCEQGSHEGLSREWLYWYDERGDRLPVPEDVMLQERQRAEVAEQRFEQERQRAEFAEQQLEHERTLRQDLLDRLRQKGINPDNL